MQPKEVVVARKTGLGLTLREMTWVAKVFYKSGMFTDTKDEAVAIVKIMAGQEMGLAPFESMTGINLIKGRPTLAAATIGAKIKASPKYDYRVKVATEVKSQIDFYENDNGRRVMIGSSTFTMEQAKAAGLANKDNWRAYPEDMLFARNISRGSRRFTPDVFSTPVYTPEELDDAPGGLGYVPENPSSDTPLIGDSRLDDDAPEEPRVVLDAGEGVDEPPAADDTELDDSMVEDDEPAKPTEPETPVVPPRAVDEDFKAELMSDIKSFDMPSIDERRLLKRATGKITYTNLNEHEWRALRDAVDTLKEESEPNELIEPET